MAFENAHSLADDCYQQNCKDSQSITHNIFTVYFYIWFYNNDRVDSTNKLEKFKKFSSEHNLKKDGWSTFVVKIIPVDDCNKDKFNCCILFSAINTDDMKKYL